MSSLNFPLKYTSNITTAAANISPITTTINNTNFDSTAIKALNELGMLSKKVRIITTNRAQANNTPDHISLHFALKESLPNLDSFLYQHTETVQDKYFQIPDTIFTIQHDVWLKEQTITVDGELKVEKKVIIKLIDPLGVSHRKMEVTAEQFDSVFCKYYEGKLYKCNIDIVKTTRHVYYSKKDKGIRLVIGSTRLPNGQYYNHGSLRSDNPNWDNLSDSVYSLDKQKLIISQSSPVVVRLLIFDPSLKHNLEPMINCSDICQISPYFTKSGLIPTGDENDLPEIQQDEEYFEYKDIDWDELDKQCQEIERNFNYLLGGK